MCGNCLYKLRLYCFLFLLILTSSIAAAQPCNCDHTILTGETYIDGYQLGVQPGDTVCIMAGKKKFLNLFNFEGTAASPVVFINCGGLVEIGDPGWHYACVIGKSHNFIFTGSGDPAFTYGITIKDTKKGVSGLAIGGSDFEIDHIEVAHTGFAGIMAKTDPDCDPASWQENYTMQIYFFTTIMFMIQEEKASTLDIPEAPKS